MDKVCYPWFIEKQKAEYTHDSDASSHADFFISEFSFKNISHVCYAFF